MRPLFFALLIIPVLGRQPFAAERPNILWITSEDNGPHLGCYGDEYAVTPHLDALAAKGCLYRKCWSNAPVCAPARTALITGMYPPSLGAQHMRCMMPLPRGIKLYPQYLREAGYYCTNNSKEDYNVEKPGVIWDDSSRKAHWKNRQPGQPFFAIFNHTISHESQIRNAIDPKDRIHDPAKVRVPAYHPDTPEVRKDWAQYYDRITMMDQRVGKNLKELEQAELADDTIVFYYGDHGSGMPRSKRWPYNSGLHVPLIIYIPPKWRHLASGDYQAGGSSNRLTSFVDLAPTLLSLAGVDIPPHMQGQAFLGPQARKPRTFLHGFRDRMDERYDMVRSVTDGRYVYICNYMPHRTYGQYINYMFKTPTTRIWKELYDAEKLNAAQSHFWEPKPLEELYDLQSDPDEVINLAGLSEHKQIQERLRMSLVDHLESIQDVGFIPEQRNAEHAGPPSPYDDVREQKTYSARQFHHIAMKCLGSKDSARTIRRYLVECEQWAPYEDVVIYWAATGVLFQGEEAFRLNRDALRKVATDKFLAKDSGMAKIVAAEALGQYGNEEDLALALDVLIEHANLEKHGIYYAIAALNAIDYLDDKARPLEKQIASLPRENDAINRRMRTYVGRLIEKILADLQ